MSDLGFIIGAVTVAVLSGYLYVQHHRRVRARYAAYYASESFDPAVWYGKPIEVKEIKTAIDVVRQDYLASRPPVRGVLFHRNLLDHTRLAVTRLPYFQDRQPEHEHVLEEEM